MSADMQQLYGFGRRIRSQIAIPGAVPAELCPQQAGRPALELRLHEPVQQAPATAPTCQSRDGAVDYGVPGLGSFSCKDGRLDIIPEPNADMAHLQAVVVATMLPTLLWQHGDLVLHAAAAKLPEDGGIVAIAGPSGCGKSTVAAEMLDQGARLVADDSLCLSAGDGAIFAHGLPGGQYRVVEGQAGRCFRPLGAEATACGGPLAAIVILERAASAAPPQRLSAVAATQALLANRHRPQVPDLLGISGTVLQELTTIVARVPVYRWLRAEGDEHISADEMAQLGTLS